MSTPLPLRTKVDLHLPVSTIVKVLATVLLLAVVMKLWISFLLFLLAVLLAVALDPFVKSLERRGLPRAAGVALIGLIMLLLGALLFGVILPAIFADLTALVQDTASSWEQIKTTTLATYPALRHAIEATVTPAVIGNTWFEAPLSWAQATLEATGTALFLLVLSLYLIVDGKRLLAWLLSYTSKQQRTKFATALPEVQDVIRGYMLGQLITSLVCGVYVYFVLTLLGVSAAVPLAFIAAVFDILPVLGTILMIIPAVLIALRVSPLVALLVLIAYLLYHVLENYIITPRVYGRQLRLSTLTVLLAIIVGGSLQGILGIVLALPIVAAYPIFERIWLHEYLSGDVFAEHDALTRATDTSREDAVVENVIQGGE